MPFDIQIHGEGSQTRIILIDEQSGTHAEVFGFGAMLNAFYVKTTNGLLNIVDGFNDPENAIAEVTNGFKSTKLSPFVCRLRDGKYAFKGENYQLERFYLGENAIHGLLYDAVFSVEDQGCNAEKAWVKLSHKYTGTDKGYPFTYSLSVTWTLHTNNQLSVTTTATNHHQTAIPFCDGWHPYFKTEGDLNEAELRFNTNRMLVFDAGLLPTGAEQLDERFINGTTLAGIELDNCFVLPTNSKGLCTLKSKQVRISIEPDETYPYLQIYTPAHRKSIAIENLSAAPDAFNNGKGLIILEPEKSASFTTSYRVELL